MRYEIQKRGGNASSPLIISEICAIVLGRYAVLCSTAPPPFRLSALQNACVCPHSGRHIDCIFFLPIMMNGKATGDFPISLVILFLNYSTVICILPSSSCVTVPPSISPLLDLRINTLLSAIPISSILAPVNRVPPGK